MGRGGIVMPKASRVAPNTYDITKGNITERNEGDIFGGMHVKEVHVHHPDRRITCHEPPGILDSALGRSYGRQKS